MDPVTGILVGASLLGGIMQATGGKKQISPDWLKEHFGPQMVNDETMDLFNKILNSPYGQQALSSAVQGGQAFQNRTETAAAAAGMGPGGGANSGASIFGTAAAGGAANAAARGVRSDLWARSLQTAEQMVQNRMNTWAGLYANQGPGTQGRIGEAIGNAAGVGLAIKSMQPKSTSSGFSPPVADLLASGGQNLTAPGTASGAPIQPRAIPHTAVTAPSLDESQPQASGPMPRALMGRRVTSRLSRFTGNSMSTIQPSMA